MQTKMITKGTLSLLVLIAMTISGCKKDQQFTNEQAVTAKPGTVLQANGTTQALAAGQLSWTMTSTGVPAATLSRITAAMNDAVARYNAIANWPARTLTVQYNTGVATADGSTNGNIRFGPNASYQAVRTAMHEIAHTYGVGLSAGWNANINNYLFTGANAVAKLQSYDGPGAVINTGGGHFWPYGLNYDNEWSETNATRHVNIVAAMVADGM